MAPTIGIVVTLALAASSIAQKTCKGAFPELEPTIIAEGFHAYILARNLKSPRTLVFDKEGNLLVVEANNGITALTLKDEEGCVSVASKSTVIRNSLLNHGLQLSNDGSQIFASGIESVYSWPYDAKQKKTTGSPTTWVTGMSHIGHFTRTLLMSQKAPGTLLVSRGSGPNIDPLARTIEEGRSQIRSFNVSGPPKQYKYTDGKVIGWGLRNSIGLGENPADGGIWSNENSSDQMKRDGKDIHETSPGEEINYHGDLIGKSELHGKNYGYPECAPAWDVEVLPKNEKLKVGSQFTYSDTVASVNDDVCVTKYVPPRLTLPAHWAPIDMAFNSKGTVAFMTSHGSWNKAKADGYKLFAITFENGQPTHEATSRTAAIPILTMKNMRTCMFIGICFRPTGVVFDNKGRLYMASDGSGEIYVITRADGSPVDTMTVKELEAVKRT